MERYFTIVSGIPANLNIGAGRLIAHLVTEAFTYGPSTEIAYAGNKAAVAAALRRRDYLSCAGAIIIHFTRRLLLWMMLPFLLRREHVVLIHFQEIGSRWCAFFIKHRKRPTWIYILDASFFCVRSYNHLPGESEECLSCIGGHFDAGKQKGCKPFPIRDRNAYEFLKLLMERASAGKVHFIAQNELHATLLKRHFGSDTVARIAGLWTVDMGDMPQRDASHDTGTSAYDVVFHADPKEAKGFLWTLRLAECCPELRFLFPCSKPLNILTPQNCFFTPLRWESGLREMISSSAITLAPSLWSAPIEGALVKSVLHAPRVAAPRILTAYSSEISATLVCHLDLRIDRAATQLRERISKPPNDTDEVHKWISRLRENARLLERISHIIQADHVEHADR